MNVGIIGLGYWGTNIIRNLYESNLCDKIVCCDIEESKIIMIKNRYPTVSVTSNYKEILYDISIDAVIVSTQESSHYCLGKEILKSGKHVFIEKPFTTSSTEAMELIQISADVDRIIMVGHTFEYSPPVLKIKDLIQGGDIGKIYYICTSRINLGLHRKDVSVIWDLAPHDLSSIFFWIDEEPLRISAVGRDNIIKNIPDVAFINLEFASGCIANIQVSWLSPSKLRRTTIVGSEKMLVYDDTETIEKIKIYDKGVNYKDPDNFGEFQLSYRAGDIVIPRLDAFEPLNSELRHFIKCCETNKQPKTDGFNGLRVVKALEAAEKSIRNGGIFVELK
jgi:predicted dehydrogenase